MAPPKPKRSRRGRLVALGLVLALAGGAIGAGVWAYRHNQQEAQLALIRSAVIDFAEATDTVDFERMSELLCDEEAAQLNDSLDPDALDGPIEPARRLPVNIGDITVDGDTATAAVTRPPAPTRTMQLKRDRGEWRLCDPEQ